eukprot:SAG31_NODE_2958_length_4852_cov_1.980644_3_plen_112_part_00
MAYLGDIRNNMTYDLMRGAALMGYEMAVAGPPGPGFEIEDGVMQEVWRSKCLQYFVTFIQSTRCPLFRTNRFLSLQRLAVGRSLLSARLHRRPWQAQMWFTQILGCPTALA